MMPADGREPRHASEADAVSRRCLLLLEQLLPIERTAFLLHDVFGRSRSETARLVGVSEDTCQRLLLRVRGVMTAAKPTIDAERKERQQVTNSFASAVRNRDVDLLATMLAPDAVAYVGTAQSPVSGRCAVTRLVDHLSADLVAGRAEISLEISVGLVQTVRWVKRTSRACRDAGA